MENKANDYKGLDNRDLKLINLESWEIPRPHSSHEVRSILRGLAKMAAGEQRKVQGLEKDRVFHVRSALWRQIKRHEIPATVMVRGGELYVRRLGAEASL